MDHLNNGGYAYFRICVILPMAQKTFTYIISGQRHHRLWPETRVNCIFEEITSHLKDLAQHSALKCSHMAEIDGTINENVAISLPPLCVMIFLE